MSQEQFSFAQPAYLQNLNPPQLQAVEHYKGPIIVLAGAGSGKTRVLTNRVVHLVVHHKIAPQNILAVTFTNKATDEMRERLRGLLGERAGQLWVSTFHAAALRMLRRHAPLLSYTNDFVVYDDDDSRGLIKEIMKELAIDEKRYPPALFRRYIDRAKNAFLLPAEAQKRAKSSEAQLSAEVYEHYQRSLLRHNAMDFGDLLVNSVLILQQHKEVLRLYQENLHFILVDEFQDTNHVQYLFLRLISALHKNILVVGDDDQSIYAFRGANVGNILEFERDFPGTSIIKLEQNYRSSGNILEASHAVIEKNTRRKDKKLWTEQGKGAPLHTYVGSDELDEAQFIARQISNFTRAKGAYRDIAIFYRTNAQSRAIEEALMQARIPYRIYGGLKFYERKEIKDILAYLRLLVNDQDNQAFLRSVNTPPRGVGPQTVQTLVQRAREQESSLLLAAMQWVDEVGEGKAKGLSQFVAIIKTLKEEARTHTLAALIGRAIELSEYEKRLKTLKDPTAQSRIENLRELEALGASVVTEGETPLHTLRGFLDRVSLSSSAELPVEESKDASGDVRPNTVSLMTLHLAKGLEFPLVFLTGVEEGLLPHYRAIEEGGESIEEERRLCYVGITRAREQLYLTRASNRGMFSAGSGFGLSGRYRLVSRFAEDIPENCLEHLSTNFTTAASPALLDIQSDPDFDENDYGYGGRSAVREGRGSKEIAYRGPGAGRNATPLLASADRLNAAQNTTLKRIPVAVPEGPLALAHELQTGVRVMHPYLGKGTVQEITGDGTPETTRISIKFDEYEIPKKLILKFARLSLANEA